MFTKKGIAPKVQSLLDWGVEVVGHLTEPSYIKLAVTDLSMPEAIFEFLTVVDTPTLTEQVKNAGLTNAVFVEGLVSTVDDDKWP